MLRSRFSWLLCALLGIALALSPLAMAGAHATTCPHESITLHAEAWPAVVEAQEHPGHDTIHVMSACQLCAYCGAGLVPLPMLSALSLSAPRLAALADWPAAPLERLERPPRV